MVIEASRLGTRTLTPALVSELVEEWKKEPLDYEDISLDNILSIVLHALAEGRCSDPQECARVAVTVYEIGGERNHQWFQR